MKNDYNKIAPFYDLIAQLVFGRSIKNAQRAFLEELPKKGQLLFIGGGTGKLLQELIELRPELEIDYLDASEEMISSSQKKIKGKKHHVNFILGTSEAIPLASYDAILSFFYLDLFQAENRKMEVAKLFSKLKSRGLWLVADFTLPTNRFQKFLETVMFRFLKISTNIQANRIEDYRGDIAAHELEKVSDKFFYSAFIFSSLYKKGVE